MHLNDLKNDISRQIDNPKESSENNINKTLDGISSDLTQYKSLEFTSDNDEANELIDKLFLTLKDNCNEITKIKDNNLISDYTRNLNKINFEKNNYNFSDAISSAVIKNKADAEKLFNKIDREYENGIITLLVFFIISIISILLIATMVMKLLKKSISSLSSILDTLAGGDFTVEIENHEKSEIGLMKNELAVTINSISYILKLIKDGSLLTLEKSKSLESVSKEMESTMKKVDSAIHSISNGALVRSNELMIINESFSKLGDEIVNIAASTQEVTISAENLANTAQLLTETSNNLIEQVNSFKLKEELEKIPR
jgi:methyl-accepting chemotaxis protein